MPHTLIIACNKCGNMFLAANKQKTRTCPYCGKRVNLTKAKHIASAKNTFEASKLLREIKHKKGFNHQ